MKERFYIQWHITNLCDLRCKHCYQDDFSRSGDLDWARLKKISENIRSALENWNRKACIHLTGGEPLLKPELSLLLDHLDQNPVVEELGIITNGLFLNGEIIRKLSALSKFGKIKISLDGADSETNDSIRSKGTFEKVMRNIPLIKEAGRFEILFMFTAMKRNFRNLPSLFKLCQDLGADGLIIERFVPLGRGRKILEEVLSKEEWKEMIRILLDFFSIEDINLFLPYQAFQISFKGEEPELLGAPCVIGTDGLCVMPDGGVFPCRRLPINIGNLLETSLKQIWEESDLLQRLRRKKNLKGKCGECEMEGCRGCRSLAFSLTGDYLGEDPHCWSFKN
jgi:radical SAM protein with 4Fe4S-binding SPASM domain